MRYDHQLNFDSENNSHVQVIKRVPAGSSVLEMGCATGFMSQYLKQELDCSVVGVDIDPQALERAKAHCDRVISADVEDPDWWEALGDAHFDVITCADIIEHLKSPESFLERIKHYLAPGGVLLASIPNGAHASIRLELLGGELAYEDEGLLDRTHLHLFTLNSIRRLFADAGYQLAELAYTFYDLPDPVIERRLEQAGLSVTEKALALLHTPEASAYQYLVTAKSAEQAGDQVTIPELTDKPIRESGETYRAISKKLHETQLVAANRDALLEARDKLLVERNVQLRERDERLQQAEVRQDGLKKRLGSLNHELHTMQQQLHGQQAVNKRLQEQQQRRRVVEQELRQQLASHSRALKSLTGSRSWKTYRILTLPVRGGVRIAHYLWFLVRHPRQFPVWLGKLHHLWRQGGVGAIKHHLRKEGNHPARPANPGYKKWIEEIELPGEPGTEDVSALVGEIGDQLLISIVMPVYNVEERWLRQAIDSVIAQSYPHWELCIADDASTMPHVQTVLDEYRRQDQRIKVVFREENGHISESSNSALELATGKYVGFMDHDDLLAPNALYQVAKRIKEQPDCRLIYSDEDKITPKGVRFAHYLKPDFNPDLMLSHNLVCHFAVYEKSLVEQVGGLRKAYEGAQDYDLALRCIAEIEPEQIAHIPRILYHWRAIPKSTASGGEAKPYAQTAAINAISAFLEQRGVAGAEVTSSPLINGMIRVRYPVPQPNPLVTIIIPTHNQLGLLKQCIESIREKTDYRHYEILVVDNRSDDRSTLDYLEAIQERHDVRVLQYDREFNFSAINNFAVKEARGEFLCFLNNDIEVIATEWLGEMISQAARKEIGAVGARLLYPDGRLQHGGVVTGLGGVAGHAMKYLPESDKGYNARAVLVQNYSAVTAACMVVRKEVFEAVGGYNEQELSVAFNDVDLCLRIQEQGFRNLWTPYAELYHHESASRGAEDTREKQQRFGKEIAYMKQRWGASLMNDPAYNPNLTKNREDFSLNWNVI